MHYKDVMWYAFEDELTKTASFQELSDMEKAAMLAQVRAMRNAVSKGVGKASDGINNAYFGAINKLGLDPLQAHGILESGMHAGMSGGMGAAAKNMGVGLAVAKGKSSRAAARAAGAVDNVFGEAAGVGGMLSRQGNVAANQASYAMRPSFEGLVDSATNLIGSAF
jgi:hypothetical protein